MSTKHRSTSTSPMHELGQRIRAGWAKEQAVDEKKLEVARQAVREQWEKEHAAGREQQIEPAPEKAPEREPNQPDMDR